MRNIIKEINRILFPGIQENLWEKYTSFKFYKNNLMILILSVFLVFEQMVYGIFISAPESDLQHMYFFCAAVMSVYTLISIYFHRKRPHRISRLHEFYELSFGIFGMGVALVRFLFIEADAKLFHIPTIYIAVIYAVAVIYVFYYWQSFFLYLSLSLAVIFLMPEIHPEISSERYVADILSNGIIAFIISVINYRNFLKEFKNKNKIEQNNNELIEKNRQIEKINMELELLSITDGLTGLYNRRKLDQEIREHYENALRYGHDFSVILMDIDHFKDINDTFGHDAGDFVLKKISDILKMNIRDVDTCGRWGGEEFIILCPETSVLRAYQFAERLRNTIKESEIYSNCRVTSSFGIASYAEFNDLKKLLKTADDRLYEAKFKGRDRVVAGS